MMDERELLISFAQWLAEESEYGKVGSVGWVDSYLLYKKDLQTKSTEAPDFTTELRDKFFRECTTETPKERGLKKVNMTPHNLFEWFKSNLE